MENTINATTQSLIENFSEMMSEKTALDEKDVESLSGIIGSSDELAAGLPMLRDTVDMYKDNAASCDRNIKQWQESKKNWTAKAAMLKAIILKTVDKLAIPGRKLAANGAKLSVKTTTSTDVDEEWLLSAYRPMAENLGKILPPYVKVKLSLDMNELNAFLKKDSTMLLENPEKIHTKSTDSLTLK